MTKQYSILLHSNLNIAWSCQPFAQSFPRTQSLTDLLSSDSKKVLQEIFASSTKDYSKTFIELQSQLCPFSASLHQNQLLLKLYLEQENPLSISKDLLFERAKTQEAYQSKTQFLSAMSHEIRTPLNAIMGMTHLLLEEEPKAQQISHLNTLSFNSEKLLILINDILDYSQIDSGNIHFHPEAFSPKQLLQDCLDRYEMKASLKDLSLTLNIISLPHKIHIDGTRFSQILSNLISNAIKYTTTGTIEIHASFPSLQGVSHIQVEVKDTGVGIHSQYHQMIFDRFSQATPSHSKPLGGTGLGLSIVKKLVELQKGTIEVESEENHGSLFRVLLPCNLIENSPHKNANLSSSSLDLIGMHILLVDDLPINILVASKFLKKKGAMITSVENGLEAYSLCQKESFDFILMDLHMPVMDGFQATQNIRTLTHHKKTPIVALTADVMGDIHKKCEDFDMDGYLSKPIRPQELYDRIRSSLA